MGNGATQRSGCAVAASILGLVAVIAYAVAGALQTLVWNPLAAVPGARLEEIHAGLERANETLAAPWVVTWAIIGPVLAVLVVVLAAVIPKTRAKYVVAADLVLIVLAAPSHWFAAFPAGMGIADAFATSGGDHAPWGMVLYGVSFVALVLVFVAALVLIVRAASK